MNNEIPYVTTRKREERNTIRWFLHDEISDRSFAKDWELYQQLRRSGNLLRKKHVGENVCCVV